MRRCKYCSNALAKLNALTLRAFAEILQKVPRSRAVLKAKPFASKSVRERYFKQFGE